MSSLGWFTRAALLAAHVVVGVVTWSLLDVLPRDVYWFCLLEMNISTKVAYLAIVLVVPPLILVCFRFAAAKYAGVLHGLCVVCLLAREAQDPQVNLATSSIGVACALLAHLSTWTLTDTVLAFSPDRSCSPVTLSISGTTIAIPTLIWLRWGAKSLNPLLAANAATALTVFVAYVPGALAAAALVYHRARFATHEQLPTSPLSSKHPRGTPPRPLYQCRAAVGISIRVLALASLFFLTQWLYAAPTAVPRWLGAPTSTSWVGLVALLVGTFLGQILPPRLPPLFLLVGVICFAVPPRTSAAALPLIGTALMALALPSLWLHLLPLVFAPWSDEPTVHPVGTDAAAVTMPPKDDDPTQLNSTTSPTSPQDSYGLSTTTSSSIVGCTTFVFLLVYLVFVALTIVLTCYNYLPQELAFLRGQRYTLLYVASILVVVATVSSPGDRRPAPSERLWLASTRMAVLTAICLVVVLPVVVLRAAVYLPPGSRMPPSTGGAPGTTSDVRIFSFNVYQGFNRAGTNNFVPILRMIQDFDPHVIALQESDTMQMGSGEIDLTDFLASTLGMYSYANPRTDEDSFGCTMFSVFPIDVSMSEGGILPSPIGENACLQRVTLDVHGTALSLVNVHLGNDGMAEKQLQLDAIVQHVVASGSGTGPLLLVGDFNTRKYTSQYNALVHDSALADAGVPANCIPTYDMGASTPIEFIFYRNLTCIQFDYPHTYSQFETADSFPRIGHFNLTRRA
ncbi:Aste57867_22046 [Aphanomyces stellatus]|uniref:Aste57867_22046 protein n=1 Tax=Aphanomyces stellatus TaxID=120398 RepID=A0A485LJ60_9STRA|nr:hypothetical protein As57867_021977 [Aphanomyces stellatus]VFT98714.1 Aste57867_22046 [Aphanomyces stellatus]